MADVHVKVVNSSDQVVTLLLDEESDFIQTLKTRQGRGDYKSVQVIKPRAPKPADDK